VLGRFSFHINVLSVGSCVGGVDVVTWAVFASACLRWWAECMAEEGLRLLLVSLLAVVYVLRSRWCG
jgi:hypothetical protein